MCNSNSQIKFKPIMLKPCLCDIGDAYILLKGAITITGEKADDSARRLDQKQNWVIFKTFTSFDAWISETNGTDDR